MFADGWYNRTPVVAGLSAAALLLLGWVGYDGYLRVRQLAEADSAGTRVPVATPAPSLPPYRLEELVAAHLFGRSGELAARSAANAPETQLNMTLHGVIAAEGDDRLARAVIEVAGKGTKSYRIGDPVEGTDAKVHGVEVKRVLLDRGGVIESLPMERELVESNQPVPAGVPVVQEADLPQPSPPVHVDVPPPPEPEAGPAEDPAAVPVPQPQPAQIE